MVQISVCFKNNIFVLLFSLLTPNTCLESCAVVNGFGSLCAAKRREWDIWLSHVVWRVCGEDFAFLRGLRCDRYVILGTATCLKVVLGLENPSICVYLKILAQH